MTGIHVIVVTYNSRSVVEDCLRSLMNQTLKGFTTTIVDNASTDGTATLVSESLSREEVPFKWRVLTLPENMGFAGAHLEAMRQGEADYIATVNPDTVLDSGWLQGLFGQMTRSSLTGACASRLMVHGLDVVDSAGDGFSTALKGYKIGEGQKTGETMEAAHVFGACAGAALYRREMLQEIGFLDEDFFLIHEDTDLNFRAQLAGWKVMYVPTAVVHHKVRSSIGTMSPTAVYYSLCNSELVRMKSVPLGILLRCLPEVILSEIAEFAYFAIRHRFFRLYFKAKFDALRMLPSMLRKRRGVMKTKKVSNDYLLSIMTPLWDRAFLKAKLRKLFRG